MTSEVRTEPRGNGMRMASLAWHNIRVIMGRELKSYFTAPIAYIFITVFALVTGIKFMMVFFLEGQASMRSFFDWLPVMLLVFIPPVTMRLWAEERKHGTIEFLLTLPMKTWHVLMGKYLAGLGFYLVALASSLPIPVMLAFVGEPDWGPIFAGYLGAVLLGAFYLALGIFVSGFFIDQIIAYIVIVFVLAILSFCGWWFIPMILDGTVEGLGDFAFRHVGVTGHFESLGRGIVDLKDIIYFISYTVVFLLLNNYFIGGLKLDRRKFIKGFTVMAAVMLGIAFMLNLIVTDNVNTVRLDTTGDGIFTVSSSTTQVFEKLPHPVSVAYYVTPSDKMPSQLKNLERMVTDQLKEYQRAAAGKLSFKVYHPDPDSAAADKLARKGVQPQQVQSLAADAISLKLVYSILVVSYLNQPDETIQLINPGTLGDLEYELASAVSRLTYAVDDTDYGNDSLFTLAEAPDLIYRYLKPGDIRVTYVVSDPEQIGGKLPERFKGVQKKITERLELLEKMSSDTVNVEVITPAHQSYSSVSRVLVGKGLLAAVQIIPEAEQLSVGSTEDETESKQSAKDKGADMFISGIYLTYRDREQDAISLVDNQDAGTIVVEINKKICRLMKRTKPRLALIAPRSKPTEQEMMMAKLYRQMPPRGQDDFKRVEQVLSRQGYEVIRTDLAEDDPVPDDVGTVLVIKPQELNERQKYEIDRLVHEGKNFIFAVQKQDISVQPGRVGTLDVMARKLDPKLNDLLKTYGVTVKDAIYLDKHTHIMTVYTQRKVDFMGMSGYQQVPQHLDHPVQVKVLPENMARDLSFTNKLSDLFYYGGNPLKIDENYCDKHGLEYTTIFRGSDRGWTSSVSGVISGEAPGADTIKPNLPLAVMVKGAFPSLYEGKEVPAWPQKEETSGEDDSSPPDDAQQGEPEKENNRIVGEARPATIIVMGCAELFNNNFVSASSHTNLLLNMVDVLTLDEDLVNIRTKSQEARRIKTLTDGEKTFWKLFVIGLAPLLLAVAGIFVITREYLRANRPQPA